MSSQSDKLPDAARDYHCLTCGYNLRGVPSNRCPECGRAFSLFDSSTYRAWRSASEIRRGRVRFADHWGRRLSWWTIICFSLIVLEGGHGAGCGFMVFFPSGSLVFVAATLGAFSLIASNLSSDTLLKSLAIALGTSLLWAAWIPLVDISKMNPVMLITSVPFLLTSVLKLTSEIVVVVNRA